MNAPQVYIDIDSEAMGTPRECTGRQSIKENPFTVSGDMGKGIDNGTDELNSFYDPREMLE